MSLFGVSAMPQVAKAHVTCSCGAAGVFSGITSYGVHVEVQAFHDAHAPCRRTTEPENDGTED